MSRVWAHFQIQTELNVAFIWNILLFEHSLIHFIDNILKLKSVDKYFGQEISGSKFVCLSVHMVVWRLEKFITCSLSNAYQGMILQHIDTAPTELTLRQFLKIVLKMT